MFVGLEYLYKENNDHRVSMIFITPKFITFNIWQFNQSKFPIFLNIRNTSIFSRLFLLT